MKTFKSGKRTEKQYAVKYYNLSVYWSDKDVIYHISKEHVPIALETLEDGMRKGFVKCFSIYPKIEEVKE